MSTEAYDSTIDTMEHITLVRHFLQQVRDDLTERADVHDASKFEEPEKSAFDIIRPRLERTPYGTEEYRATLREFKPALGHHFAHNRHHPEHFPNGIAGMTLSDVYEMLCDWVAASRRRPGGHLDLARNITRFGITDQLAHILANTIDELGWEDEAR